MNDLNDQTLAGYNGTVDTYIQKSPQTVDGDIKVWIDQNLAALGPTARILEIGSGSGKDADYFASRGFRMELTDASQGFVDYINSHGKQARILNAITDELGSGYDMVFADAVFLHFNRDQLTAVLHKVFDALKPQGRIVFTLKAGTGDEITKQKLNVPRYFCYWESEDIRRLLEDTGFADIETTVSADYRGPAKPDWLFINAIKPSPGHRFIVQFPSLQK